mmetsp:Transcript_3889/g.5941  ORF Transcript_3889/g.5941 Transcript_3889/m.5941 type:complete len:272 (-) Transcript_3889:62-877(-)
MQSSNNAAPGKQQENSNSMFNLLNDSNITPLPPPSAPPVIEEEPSPVYNKPPEYSSAAPGRDLDAGVGTTNGLVTVMDPSQQQGGSSKFKERQRCQMYGVIGLGLAIIVLSIVIGLLIMRAVGSWKTADATVVQVSDIKVDEYDYCKEDDVRPLDVGETPKCELVYVCSFDFRYRFTVDDDVFFGSSAKETDYEEVDCYEDMLIEQEFFANSEEPIEIYYNPKDPSDNDYYEQVDGVLAGGIFILVGVLAGVSMIIFGVSMLCCGRCCCIE